MNVIIITGASSGIGLQFALQMDAGLKNIDEFWLVARREDKLREAAELLDHRTRIFPIDITDSVQLDILEKAVKAENAVVRMLVNCAGFGKTGSFAGQDRASVLGMIRLNCMALTEMTHRMIPSMRRNSRIIQMASAAAFLPQPDFAVYAAGKSYVLSFSRALCRELKPLGIWVTCVCPGPVDTPFLDIAGNRTDTPAIKKLVTVDAEKVVERALRDSCFRREMSVYGILVKSLYLISGTVPHKIILKLMSLMKKG